MMADKQLTDLKKKLAELSQKSPKKQTTEEAQPKAELPPTPIPTPVQVSAPVPTPIVKKKFNPEELDLLKQQIEKMEKMQEEEKEVPQEVKEAEEPSEEDVQKFQQLQAEIERLQNTGVFRTEAIYQLVGINSSLERIVNTLEKTGGTNA